MHESRPLIAIVDDDISICRALKRLICSLGMNAETFPSSEAYLEAVDAMPQFRPDCLIVDLQMPAPGMDGLALQSRLSGSGLPVIFITAFDDPAAREQAQRAGAAGYLRKPFNDELLIRTLESVLGQWRTEA